MAYEPKGDYKTAPIFTGEYYSYWKACMQIHINTYDKGVWEAILNGPTPVTYIVGGVTVPKPENLWDEKKWSCDWKAKNIIISALSVDELYRISIIKP